MSPKKKIDRRTAKAESTNGTATEPDNLLGLEALNNAADCLRILAHPHRLMIVQLLLSGKPFTLKVDPFFR